MSKKVIAYTFIYVFSVTIGYEFNIFANILTKIQRVNICHSFILKMHAFVVYYQLSNFKYKYVDQIENYFFFWKIITTSKSDYINYLKKETRTYLQESCEINLMKSLKRTIRLVPMYSLHQQVFITSQNADSGTKNEDD